MFSMFSRPKNAINAMRDAWSSAKGGRGLARIIIGDRMANPSMFAALNWGGTAVGGAAGYMASDDHKVRGAVGGALLGHLAGTAGGLAYTHRGALKGIGNAGLKAFRG